MNNSETLGINIPIDFIKLGYKTKSYVENFNCGNKQIDYYFQHIALNDNNTVTYLFIDKSKDVTIACVSVCCSRIDIIDSNGLIEATIPAFEIKYFAINEKYHKKKYKEDSDQTLSKVIMDKMIYYLYDDCRSVVGASKIILYSLKRAVHFYEGCYFKKFEPFMKKSEDTFVSECTPMYFDLDPEF